MTDTGQFPVEGQPEGAGGEPVPQHGGLPAAEAEPMGPGWAPDPAIPPAAPAYTFLDQPDEEDDLLLMPGPQGSWGDPQAAPPAPGPARVAAAAPCHRVWSWGPYPRPTARPAG
ncbi:hypothetical protein ACFW9F_06085, partial [Streptomyces sp. NPDC059506]|uniref:hypothetical protein n=1 Tax=Streptomyces sp. NPDC059506 TaxID=3347751 RepID=UPI003694D403